MKIHLAYYLGTKKENSSATWLDRLICFATKSRYSHMELVYDYQPNGRSGCWSASPRDGGVRYASINLQSGHWEIYEMNLPSRFNREYVRDFFELQDGKKYDWVGALGVYFPFLDGEIHRWFCSEIIGMSLGVTNPHEKSPEDLYQHFALRKHRRIA